MQAGPNSAAVAQLVQQAQQEIYQCHLQRRSLDLHLAALEKVLQQLAATVQVADGNSVMPPLNEPLLRNSSDPPVMLASRTQLSDTVSKRGGPKPNRRNKKPGQGRVTASSVPPSNNVQILKAPQRSSPDNVESSGPPTSGHTADGFHEEPESSDNITAVHLDTGDIPKPSKVPVKVNSQKAVGTPASLHNLTVSIASSVPVVNFCLGLDSLLFR